MSQQSQLCLQAELLLPLPLEEGSLLTCADDTLELSLNLGPGDALWL